MPLPLPSQARRSTAPPPFPARGTMCAGVVAAPRARARARVLSPSSARRRGAPCPDTSPTETTQQILADAEMIDQVAADLLGGLEHRVDRGGPAANRITRSGAGTGRGAAACALRRAPSACAAARRASRGRATPSSPGLFAKTRARSSVGAERLEHEVLRRPARRASADRTGLDLVERVKRRRPAGSLMRPSRFGEPLERHAANPAAISGIMISRSTRSKCPALDRRQGLDAAVGRLLHVADAQALEPAHEQVNPHSGTSPTDQHRGGGRRAHGAARSEQRTSMPRGRQEQGAPRAGCPRSSVQAAGSRPSDSRAPAAEPSGRSGKPAVAGSTAGMRVRIHVADACQRCRRVDGAEAHGTRRAAVSASCSGPPLAGTPGTPGARRGRTRARIDRLRASRGHECPRRPPPPALRRPAAKRLPAMAHPRKRL